MKLHSKNEARENAGMAEVIQQDLGEIGIDLDIGSREKELFLSNYMKGQYDFALSDWAADFNDPVGMLEVWTSNSENDSARLGKVCWRE